ncbi:Spore protein SP21 [Caloramator mitchellensis]|uniref:Spore protein SP21 n=1 Tax=Caloramator mitchellensis TaxID=908809 RepID=A0A0R3K386_CALMK|nr:Hsp20/alpha crystallin family protein [Caloramator mitchellensis]KRQ87394.1 Spore protein SP21 [Caloramator mitchellensis]
MSLIPFNPFNDLERLRRDVDDVFKSIEFYERPRVDVFETENEVKVVADIPGISKEDLDITVYDDEVRISGEIRRTAEYNEESIRRSERYHGKFSRVISLPSEVKSEEAKADYKDGVLTLTIPKLHNKATKGKRIRLS